MALGSPAISNARSVEPREINGLVASIRQRIEALERLVILLQNTAPGPTSAADIQTLKIQVAQLQQVVNSLSSGSSSALLTQTLRASSAVRQFYPVYGSGSGTCAEADPNDPTTIYNVLGVALAAAASGASVIVQREGVVTITGVAFTAFEPVFLGVDGLTQWPEYTNVSVPIGIALSTTTMYVKPGFPALQYLGVYNDAEQHMPVTYKLLAQALLPLTQLLASSDGYVFLSDGQLITLTSGGGGGGGGGGGYVNDGDYVDIEVTFGGTVWTIKPGQVTLAKLADLPAETIIGNVNLSGPGTPQALTPTQVKSMLNIDVGDIIDFVESVLALLATSFGAGNGVTVSANSAGVLTVSAPAARFTNDTSPPSFPNEGERWFDPDDGILYTYVDGLWVEL